MAHSSLSPYLPLTYPLPSSVYSVMDMRHLPCAHFESRWTPMHHKSTGSMLMGHRECYMWIGQQKSVDTLLQVSPLLICMLHRPFGLHSQNMASRIKLLRILGWQHPRPSECKALCNSTSHMPIKQALAELNGHNQSYLIPSNGWIENS